MEGRQMSDVSVIGTGVMGSALVEVLAGSAYQVTVWNRTKEKADALSGPRVRTAESVVEALTVSPLTFVAVTSQELSRTLVEEAGADLKGKVVASASFVTPDQAKVYDAVVKAAGGKYLDLSIPAYPNEVRSGSGVFLISGDRESYEAHREKFEQIGRTTTFVDETPGAAYISEMAILLAYLPMAVSLLQGLRICEHHNIPLDWYTETIPEFYHFHIKSLLGRVTDKRDQSLRNVEASINIWGDTAAEYADYLRELGLDAGMYDALQRLFSAASQAGYGEDDWTSIAEHTTGNDRKG
jgi:3-hydroxyisobutyrate dehydrogenase-like beta-hydroxyacid dehydrogenase